MKDMLNKIWFTVYSRGHKKLGSSAFEHVFLGEIKRDEVSGFHNWIYFGNQEDNKNLNYLGYLNLVQFQGVSIKLNYTFPSFCKRVCNVFFYFYYFQGALLLQYIYN